MHSQDLRKSLGMAQWLGACVTWFNFPKFQKTKNKDYQGARVAKWSAAGREWTSRDEPMSSSMEGSQGVCSSEGAHGPCLPRWFWLCAETPPQGPGQSRAAGMPFRSAARPKGKVAGTGRRRQCGCVLKAEGTRGR